ncbi:acyl-CoA thioesterase [Streptomyces sp. NPDC097619]|uniref:acyl-CoA thioesterase n=1 Tax=Streptomyces sp. NPDC097619 TaxID=3157228 RepID=UPI00332866C6
MTGRADHFAYRHTVAFVETGPGGAADYVHYLHWQGRCWQLFLRQAALDELDGINGPVGPDGIGGSPADLRLFTLQVDCELFEAVSAQDRLSVRMRVAELGHTQVDLTFDYVRETGDGEVPVARGSQRVVCLRGPDDAPVPALIPEALAQALAPYAAGIRPPAGRQT